MGSGSSRGGRALKRLRGADSRPAGPGGAAPEGGTGPPASATAAAREEAPEAAEGAAGPAAPPDGRDETLRLLDQLLAESAAWVPGELAPRGPARPRPAAGAGSPVSVGARGALGAAAPLPAPEPPPRRRPVPQPPSARRRQPLPGAIGLRGALSQGRPPSPCPRNPGEVSCRLSLPSIPSDCLPLCLLWVLIRRPPTWGATGLGAALEVGGQTSFGRNASRGQSASIFPLELWLLPA